jgi:hypothetical protein
VASAFAKEGRAKVAAEARATEPRSTDRLVGFAILIFSSRLQRTGYSRVLV